MPRHWFPNRACALDFAARNRAGTSTAQRAADHAATTRRARTRPVTLARSAVDDVPVPGLRPDASRVRKATP